MKKILPAVAVLVAAATLAACGDEDEPTTMARDDSGGGDSALVLDDLDGRAFASVRVDGHRLVDGTRIQLGFDGAGLSADAGCNHLFGTAWLADGVLVVSRIGGTEMACPDGRMEQDEWLVQFLGGGPTVELDGGTLTLTSGDVVVELEEQAAPPEPTGDPDEPTAATSP